MSSKKTQLKSAMEKSAKAAPSLSPNERADLKTAFVSPKKAQKKPVLFRLYEDEIQTLDKVVERTQPDLRESFSRNTALRVAIALLSQQKPEKIKALLKRIRVE